MIPASSIPRSDDCAHALVSTPRGCTTCATLLLMDGLSEREVMELLGHSSIAVTMNTYVHVLDEAKDALAARMDGLLGGATDVRC